MARAALLIAVLAAASLVSALAQADVATLTVQFDNRGSKVMDKSVNDKIIRALETRVFKVPQGQVVRVGGVGQSSLFNHQSVVTYQSVGPALNGRSVLANCQAAAKGGIFSSSELYKAIKKATDSWMPGDKVKVQKASCVGAGVAGH